MNKSRGATVKLINTDGGATIQEDLIAYSEDADMNPGRSAPRIDCVIPVISPLKGCPMRVTGAGFMPGLILRIGKVTVPCELSGDLGHIDFVSPPLPEGPKDVSVLNGIF